MTLDFGKGLPPDQPVTLEVAVRRGHLFITRPVMVIMLGLLGLAAVLLSRRPRPLGTALPAAMALVSPFAAWLWWSWATPRWRHWALGRGLDPHALQQLAQESGLVWPKGHIFEKTEFRFRPPDDSSTGTA